MAKRKSRKKNKPNLPQETLARARRQAGIEEESASEQTDEAIETEAGDAALADEEHVVAEQVANADTADKKPARSSAATTSTADRSAERAQRRKTRSSSSRRVQAENIQYSKEKRRRKPENLTPDDIAYRLANPTVEVSEEQLHEEYGYVLRDLRGMGVLAFVLFAAMIVIAQSFV